MRGEAQEEVMEIELPETVSSGPVEISSEYLCREYGHRWRLSGRCERCGFHRDGARASE